jgi:hypothetical protein
MQAGFNTWLDEVNIAAGEEWEPKIKRAVHEATFVIVCLSSNSIEKRGFIQKEIRIALDAAEETPEGTIYVIPILLDDCVVPERLRRWQHIRLYENDGFDKLLASLSSIDVSFEYALSVPTPNTTSIRRELAFLNEQLNQRQSVVRPDKIMHFCNCVRNLSIHVYATALVDKRAFPATLQTTIREVLNALSRLKLPKTKNTAMYVKAIRRRTRAMGSILNGEFEMAESILHGFSLLPTSLNQNRAKANLARQRRVRKQP